ncbi:hypothetical protein, partial [Alistipes putredinis]|uniref:hypothetical protein n=1 Tax=Alistipes putredinis TaxID=28117 RepID=UPI003966F689
IYCQGRLGPGKFNELLFMEISSFLHLNLLKGHGCKYTNLFRIGLKNRIKKQHFLRFASDSGILADFIHE